MNVKSLLKPSPAKIIGLGTRIAGALLAVDMLVAMLTAHIQNGFFVSNGGLNWC